MKRLTKEAEQDRLEFEAKYDEGNCSCHISPPCASCIHPGNPINQEEEESCWEELTKTYVTFGQVHTHSVDGKTLDKDCVAVIEAKDEAEGRDIAWKLFGPKFFTTYHEDQWNEDNLKYFPRGYIYVENPSDN